MRFVVFLSAIFLWGCQATPAKDFASLHPGMDKSEVLDVMGNPQRTQRWHGLDRWTYIFPENDDRYAPLQENEVHFNNGKASYVGAKFTPAISAEERDLANEAENAQLEKEAAARREENRDNVRRHNEDGTDENEVRFVPQYEPLR